MACLVLYSWLPMATVWSAHGESSHGAGKAGVPSPGNETSWEGKTEKKAGQLACLTSCLLHV